MCAIKLNHMVSSHRDTVVTLRTATPTRCWCCSTGPAPRRAGGDHPCPKARPSGSWPSFWDGAGSRPRRAEQGGDERRCDRLPVLARCPARRRSAWRRRLESARPRGSTRPLPLRYVARRERSLEDPVQRLFVPDYQGTAIWTSLGAIYAPAAGPHRPPGGRRGSGRSMRPSSSATARSGRSSDDRAVVARRVRADRHAVERDPARPVRTAWLRPPGPAADRPTAARSRRPPGGRGTGSSATRRQQADDDRQPLDPDVEGRSPSSTTTITSTAASAARTAGPTSWR